MALLMVLGARDSTQRFDTAVSELVSAQVRRDAESSDPPTGSRRARSG
jgi:hypothetical protein